MKVLGPSLMRQALTLRKSLDKFHRLSHCAQSAIIDIIHNYMTRYLS